MKVNGTLHAKFSISDPKESSVSDRMNGVVPNTGFRPVPKLKRGIIASLRREKDSFIENLPNLESQRLGIYSR